MHAYASASVLMTTLKHQQSMLLQDLMQTDANTKARISVHAHHAGHGAKKPVKNL